MRPRRPLTEGSRSSEQPQTDRRATFVTTPLSQFPKPEAEQYKARRKLFLVPNFGFAPSAPEEGQSLLERYWSEVRDHIDNLERSLGTVSHVYHETVFSEGDEGMKLVEGLNPSGYSFIQAMCRSTAHLEATEDRALVEENSDWQRCISIGLVSEKALSTALEGYHQTTQSRFEKIGARIDETLKEGEAGVLFVREDHRIQFPSDIQVFYVAPPSLDALKRWISDQIRTVAQPNRPDQEAEEPGVAEEAGGVDGSEGAEQAQESPGPS